MTIALGGVDIEGLTGSDDDHISVIRVRIAPVLYIISVNVAGENITLV
jgi:hypothetical protein